MKRLTLPFYALAALTLLALLLALQTRWLTRAQLLPPSLLTGHYEAQKTQFVENHPGDYAVQLAGQATNYEAQTQLQYARSLVPRFPDNPSLRANILRYAMTNEISLARDEDYWLGGQPVPSVRPNAKKPPTPAQLSAFDADAAAGERLDPDNAYFPFMRSVGLFAAHRDAEGLAAVRRASGKSVWREYYADEVEGRWRINDGLYGGREAIASMAVSAAVLFPHYQYLRQVARIVTYKAVLEEQAGHGEAGLTLRRSLARCGDLMRAQATTFIGNLVGIAITAVAHSWPGGIPPDHDISLPNDQRARKRLDAYCAYVTRLGHSKAAAEARAQAESGERVRHLLVSEFAFGSRTADLTRLGLALAAGWILFPNILATLLLGVIAAALCRLPQIRARRPLPAGAAFGVWGVVLAALALAGLFVNVSPESLPGWNAVGLLMPLPLFLGQMQALFGLAFSLAIPLLLTLVLAIAARVRRVPVSFGLAEGFRAAAPLLVCLLMLVYAGLMMWTVRQETRVNAGLERSLHGEAQSLAEQTGKPWPGPVR